MRTFYYVNTKIFDNGEVRTSGIHETTVNTKPENKCMEREAYDYWTDYFETVKEAKEFIKDAQIK